MNSYRLKNVKKDLMLGWGWFFLKAEFQLINLEGMKYNNCFCQELSADAK